MKTTLPYYFVSSCDGALHDTRKPDWSKTPLRPVYARHFRTITTGAQLRASLRAGDHAWPGGYALGYTTDDGCALCPGCVRDNLCAITAAIREEMNDGWLVDGLFSNAELDEPETCAHCGEAIE
jgi:hypothetical protein